MLPPKQSSGNCQKKLLQEKIFEKKIGTIHNRSVAWHDNQEAMAN